MSHRPRSSSHRHPLKTLANRLVLSGLAAAAIVNNRSQKAERDHPPTGSFIEAEGLRLHYVERGHGDPVLLLHGNTLMGLDFLLSDLVDRLAETHRVIVIDRPGYGYSDAPGRRKGWRPEAQARVMHAALERLGAQRAIVLGHSWGALVAMALALDFPESVRGLVLEAGYLYPTPRPDIPLRAPPALPVVGDVLRYTVSPLIQRASWAAMVRVLFAPAKVPSHFWRFPAWMACRPSQLQASAAEMAELAPAAWRLSQRYPDLAVPLVIIAGREDRLVLTDMHSARLHEELPHADYRPIAGMGHMLHHLVPDQVIAAIKAAEHATGAGATPPQK